MNKITFALLAALTVACQASEQAEGDEARITSSNDCGPLAAKYCSLSSAADCAPNLEAACTTAFGTDTLTCRTTAETACLNYLSDDLCNDYAAEICAPGGGAGGGSLGTAGGGAGGAGGAGSSATCDQIRAICMPAGSQTSVLSQDCIDKLQANNCI